MPWRTVERKQRLKLAVLWDDGMVRPTPPVRRALRETVEKLRRAGHEVVDWEATGHEEGNDILVCTPIFRTIGPTMERT